MKLIIINGPCGVGKSTLAKRISDEIELSVYLNIDELRTSISSYNLYLNESLELVLNMVKGIIDEAFKNGKSVIIDKMIFENEGYGKGKNNILEKYISIGKEYNAEIYEFILWGEWNTVKNRVIDRGFKKGGTFTLEKAEKFWNGINDIKDKRKNAIIIKTDSKDENVVFSEVKEIIF